MPLLQDEEAEQLRAERNRAVGALVFHRFRMCDIPACNCGTWHAPRNERAERAEARVKELEDELAASMRVHEAAGRVTLSATAEQLAAANADRDAWKAAAHDTHERERRWQSMAEIANADRARLRAASRDLYHALKRVGLGFGEYEYPGTVCTVCGTERNTMGPVGSSALGAHPHKLDCLIVTCEAALAESEKLP